MRGDLRLMGATSSGAYDEFIASDVMLDSLFQKIRLDGDFNSAEESASEEGVNGADDFVGDKVSADLRELMQNAGSKEERARVILQTDDTNNPELRKLLRSNGVKIMGVMRQLGVLDVEMPVSVVEEIAVNTKAKHLSLDRDMAFLGHIDTTTGALAARDTGLVSNSLGTVTNTALDGTDVTIAILDSSIYTGHHSFLGKDGNKRINVNVDFTGTGMNTDDPYGHGTHVAGLAAGSKGKPGDSEDIKYLTNYSGVAPNANIINLRVLDSKGMGSSSGLLKALDWLLVNRTKYNIKVVNMSLGAPAIESYKNDPLCRAARKLVDAGVVVVAAAGNNGKNAAGGGVNVSEKCHVSV